MALTKTQLTFIKALMKCKGNVSNAAQACKMNRGSHYKWCKENAEYKTRVEDIQEHTIDYVEDKLFDLIDSGNVASTLFFLKCRAKHRGYVERTEQVINVSADEHKNRMNEIAEKVQSLHGIDTE